MRMRTSKISRRELLKLSAAAAGGALLSASGVPARAAAPAARAGKKPTTITYMIWGGPERAKPYIDAFNKLYPETAEWLKVEVVSPGKHDGESYQALRLALAAGGQGLPDLIMMNYIGVPEFAAAEQLLDLGPLMAPYKDQLTPGARALSSYEGKLVGVPIQVKAKLWYFRKDLFQKAGIDVAKVKTFEDYVEAGQKYRKANPKSYFMNLGPQPIHYWYFMILSHWDDVRVADKSGNYQITKNPHFAELFKWLKTWSGSGIAFKTDDWSPDWQPAFADETIGGSLISNWMNGFLPKFAPAQKGKWGLALWPEFNRTGSEAGGGVVCIPKGAKNPEAAFEFASKLWLETKGAVEYWKFNGTPPSTKSAQDEVRKAVATMERPAGISDDDWAANPVNYFGRDFMEPTFKAMDAMKVFPYDPKASAELTILRRHAEAYLADKETLEKALAGAEADMKAQLGNPYA